MTREESGMKRPCLCINDDIAANQHDYRVGPGALTVTAVYRDGPGETLYTVVNPAEYTVETTRYLGLTTIRFKLRQRNFMNGLHSIFAIVDPADYTVETAGGRTTIRFVVRQRNVTP